ncbi:MAG: hypothetical protein K2H16_00085 [Prevotella sp.]|nr:hypothetical protein [Prevotella sp.]
MNGVLRKADAPRHVPTFAEILSQRDGCAMAMTTENDYTHTGNLTTSVGAYRGASAGGVKRRFRCYVISSNISGTTKLNDIVHNDNPNDNKTV